MSKHVQSKFESLVMKKSCHDSLLRWSQSMNEIGFLCFGKSDKITHVVRIRNRLKYKRNHFAWDQAQARKSIMIFKMKGFRIISQGHSHPADGHLRRPSNLDVSYFSKRTAHLICFPKENLVTAWLLRKKSKRLPLRVIP